MLLISSQRFNECFLSSPGLSFQQQPHPPRLMTQPPFKRTTPIITALTHSICLGSYCWGRRRQTIPPPHPTHTSSLKSWWVINERNVQPGRRCRLITGSLQGSHKYGGGYQSGCYVDGGVICLTDCVCLWWSCRLKSFVWLQSLVMMHTVLSSPEVHFYSPLYQQVHLLVLIKQQQREATSSDTTKLKLVLVSAH